jgi:lysylphosphatidylglycerol synthetase-like protein (DUF2156 family)
LLDITTLTAA